MSKREDLRPLFVEYRQSGDRAIRNQLIEAHTGIVVHIARRYANRGEPLDDLVQVGQLGLLKAVERFDPERGFEFSTFAESGSLTFKLDAYMAPGMKQECLLGSGSTTVPLTGATTITAMTPLVVSKVGDPSTCSNVTPPTGGM